MKKFISEFWGYLLLGFPDLLSQVLKLLGLALLGLLEVEVDGLLLPGKVAMEGLSLAKLLANLDLELDPSLDLSLDLTNDPPLDLKSRLEVGEAGPKSSDGHVLSLEGLGLGSFLLQK